MSSTDVVGFGLALAILLLLATMVIFSIVYYQIQTVFIEPLKEQIAAALELNPEIKKMILEVETGFLIAAITCSVVSVVASILAAMIVRPGREGKAAGMIAFAAVTSCLTALFYHPIEYRIAMVHDAMKVSEITKGDLPVGSTPSDNFGLAALVLIVLASVVLVALAGYCMAARRSMRAGREGDNFLLEAPRLPRSSRLNDVDSSSSSSGDEKAMSEVSRRARTSGSRRSRSPNSLKPTRSMATA